MQTKYIYLPNTRDVDQETHLRDYNCTGTITILMHQKRTSKRTMSGTWRAAGKVYVNQESHLRPLASETTSQGKILGLTAERFVSYTHKQVDMSRQHTS